jgi:hypothetical protein
MRGLETRLGATSETSQKCHMCGETVVPGRRSACEGCTRAGRLAALRSSDPELRGAAMDHRYGAEVGRLRDFMSTMDYRCVDQRCERAALYVAAARDGAVVHCCAEHRPDDVSWWQSIPRTDLIDQTADALATLELWSEGACKGLMDWAQRLNHVLAAHREASA